jgi:hypothetical protein
MCEIKNSHKQHLAKINNGKADEQIVSNKENSYC